MWERADFSVNGFQVLMVLGMKTRCQGKQIKITKSRMTTFLDCLGQYPFPFTILTRLLISIFSLNISWFGDFLGDPVVKTPYS